ncbi:DUF418 domain-containing protein [Bacillus sp. 2205SS5-2]|uniref:DUF418 domain-containing protein n=1 Tax=Bacillus sp. 2205SS5-2 TaxID=3109031 RepID=UPI0030056B33
MNTASNRITGFDTARALAIFGMVIVNYKIAINAVINGSDWLVFLTSLLEGRASSIFVIVAGIGMSLMTKKARVEQNHTVTRELRLLIWKRSLFLFVLGLSLFLLEWDADILHYYAFYMFIASFFIVASDKLLLFSTIAILLLSQVFLLVFNYQTGWNSDFTSYDTFWTLDGFLRNLLLNGYHPIFPWICFFLFGMWLGRFDFNSKVVRKKILVTAVVTAVILEIISFVFIQISRSSLGLEIASYLFGTKPMPPNVFYMVSSSSTAVIVILICIYFTEKFKDSFVTLSLIYTGQLALTHYVGHFLFLVLLFMFQLVTDSSLWFAVLCSFVFFLLAIALSVLWRKRYKRGPIELLMRKISG